MDGEFSRTRCGKLRVEDHQRLGTAAASGQSRLQRQGEARQLAARGDGLHRPEGRAGIGRDLESDAVQARRPRALLAQRLQRDAESGLFQLQRGQFGLDGLGQGVAGGAALAGQRLRREQIGLARLGGLLVGGAQRVLGGLDGLQPRGELGPLGRQVLDQHVELAGHAAQGEQAFLGLFQTVRLEFEGLRRRIDRGAGFLSLDQRAVDRLAGRRKARHGRAVGRRARLQGPVPRAFQRAIGRGELAGEAVTAQRVLRGGDVDHRLLGRAEQRSLLGERRFLAFAGIQAIQLREPQGEFLGLGGRAAGQIAQALGLLAGGAPGAPGRSHGANADAAERVQQAPGRLGIQQADGLVLTVNLQQQRAQILQHPDAGGLVVDERPAATVGRQLAAKNEVLVAGIVQALVVQIGEGRMVGGKREDRRRRGLTGRAPAHQPGVGARTRRQAQGVQDDGLAGPGLAGQRGQALADGEVQALDEHDVTDGKADQHGAQDRRESGFLK